MSIDYRETPPCPWCGHREHINDVCEEDLGEFGECSCADSRKPDDPTGLIEASGGEVERYLAMEAEMRPKPRHRHHYDSGGLCGCGAHRYGTGTFCAPMPLALPA